MKSQKTDVVGLITGEYNYLYDLIPFHASKMPNSKKLNTVLAASNLVMKSRSVYYMPVSIFLEFTNYCNIRCPVCATGSGMIARKPKNLDPMILEKTLDQINRYTLIASLWGWGDPLLHPEFEDMMKIVYRHGREKGMQIVLSTNGQLLNREKILETLIKYPPTCLIATVDGLDNETLGMYRVGAKLEPILEGIEWINKHRDADKPIKLHMRTIAMKQNEHQLPMLEKFAKDHYFDDYSVRSLVQIIPCEEFEKLIPEKKELRAYGYTEKGERIHKKDFFCRDSTMIPMVSAEGNLVICCEDFDGKLSYGSLYQNKFRDLWLGNRADWLRNWTKYRTHRMPCAICPMTDRVRQITNIEYKEMQKIDG